MKGNAELNFATTVWLFISRSIDLFVVRYTWFPPQGGHLTVVGRLFQKKAAVNAAAGSGGRTALRVAAEGGNLAVVERLL